MKISRIKLLGAAAIIVGILYVFVNVGGDTKHTPSFSKNIEWAKISKISLSKEGKIFELTKKEDTWVIPSKFNYRAQDSSVQSFLLKLADISNAQKVQISDSGVDRLGLSEESKSKGQGIISLSYGDKEASKIYLGALRSVKGEPLENQLSLSGQYVKSAQDSQVYMIPLAISLQMEAKDWMSTEILRILPNTVYQIVLKNGADNSNSDTIVIDRSDTLFSSDKASFKANVKIPGGKKINVDALSQVSSALESFTIDDIVSGANDDSGFMKVGYALYRLTSGLEYRIDFYKKDALSAVRVFVDFNKELAGSLLKIQEDFIASKKSEGGDNKDTDKASIIEESRKIVLSDQSKAQELHKQFDSWLYAVSDTQFLKMYKKTSEFLVDQEKQAK